MNYLIDTNNVIYYFNGLVDDEKMNYILANSFCISVITKIEFLGWAEFGINQALYKIAKDFIGHAEIFGLSDEIVETTIELRQRYKIKTPDAIIAATALTYDLTIVTNNTNDFRKCDAQLLALNVKSA